MANGGNSANSEILLTDRLIRIGDCPNFRSLGGYRTRHGTEIRGDLLLRGGCVDWQSQAAAAAFDALGISRIYDFRNASEIEKEPTSPTSKRPIRINFLPIDRGSMGPYIAKLPTMAQEDINLKSAMATMYREMIDDGENKFRSFFSDLLHNKGSTLIMCTLGKDRTGVASALLLSALGVHRDTIMDDYLLSAEAYRDYGPKFDTRMKLAEHGLSSEIMHDVLTVRPEYLEAALGRTTEISGTIENYLAERMGLNAQAIDKLSTLYTASV